MTPLLKDSAKCIGAPEPGIRQAHHAGTYADLYAHAYTDSVATHAAGHS